MNVNPILNILSTLNGGHYDLTDEQARQLPKNTDLRQTEVWLPGYFTSVHSSMADQLGLDVADIPPRIALNRLKLDVPIRHERAKIEDIPTRDAMALGDPFRRWYRKHLHREPDQRGYEWWLKDTERRFVEGIDN